MTHLSFRSAQSSLFGAALACALVAAGPAAPAFAGDLAQVVSADEAVAPAGQETVIDHGHVDFGALVGDQAELLARDDSGEQPTWRHVEDVVFQVSDAALQTLPEKSDFDFVGADGGQQVWVVPQTEVAGVPWVGWNTQAPSLVDAADRGINMEFLGHSGPGDFSLFLQNGGFEAPQVLWSTASGQSDSFWVDLGTHTHANWTFTEPGIHQIGIRISGKTKDGSPLSAEGALTFAVGDGTDVAAAQQAQWDPAAASTGSSRGVPTWVWVVAAGVVVVILVGVGLALRRRPRA